MQHTHKKDMLHTCHGSVSVTNGFGASIYSGKKSLSEHLLDIYNE